MTVTANSRQRFMDDLAGGDTLACSPRIAIDHGEQTAEHLSQSRGPRNRSIPISTSVASKHLSAGSRSMLFTRDKKSVERWLRARNNKKLIGVEYVSGYLAI